MERREKRNVYILLTRFPDNGAKIIEVLTGCYYTHASIGLEEDLDTFYSFQYKGFIVEKISRYIRPNREPYPCQLYEFAVSEQAYGAIKKLLDLFAERKSAFRYSRLGLVLSLLRIPYRRKGYYFCSQFVAEVLQRSQACRLRKSTALYYPGDLRTLPGMQLVFGGNILGMAKHLCLPPCLA